MLKWKLRQTLEKAKPPKLNVTKEERAFMKNLVKWYQDHLIASRQKQANDSGDSGGGHIECLKNVGSLAGYGIYCKEKKIWHWKLRGNCHKSWTWVRITLSDLTPP